MKKALVFIADGSEEVETFSPVDYLRRAGVEVTLVAVGTASRTVTMSRKVSVNADMTLDSYLSSASADLPDAVVVPGGMPGASNIASSKAAVALVQEMQEAGRLVCAICASPALVLSKTSALEGKSWTCYPGMEGNAKAFSGGYRADCPFVHDGNVITGRGPGAAEEFSMEIVKALCGQAAFDDVRKAALLR
ncbi:MAG: DJ-1/PfpI family protein [Treponema sp.]|nr:DJ-1/PfpI family protein [Treponema sp.]